jgi:transposase
MQSQCSWNNLGRLCRPKPTCSGTTRDAKWATVQVGTGRTVSEVAGELACDWHTVNDAVTTWEPVPCVGSVSSI